MPNSDEDPISSIEARIALLAAQLEEAKTAVRQWADATASLSQSAAEARAKNQGAGRGLFGALFGPKFRSAMRTGAAASNASIAKEVADKRSRIADGKRAAQEAVRDLQAELAAAKNELKEAKSANRRAMDESASAEQKVDPLPMLKKLKEAHSAGLLTDDEYEEKRKKLVAGM